MKTYPHQEGCDIIELVRKDEHDAIVRELNERLTKQQADPLAEAVKRMEEVPLEVLREICAEEWCKSTNWPTLAAKAIRVRLIQAVKGDQP